MILDVFLYVLHVAVTGFNLFGWIPTATRRLHRWCVGLTTLFWIVAGAAVGVIGYCPLTDWHWYIKEQRGETGLPGSFITYVVNQAGFYPDPAQVNIVVGCVFVAIVLITVAVWLRERRSAG